MFGCTVHHPCDWLYSSSSSSSLLVNAKRQSTQYLSDTGQSRQTKNEHCTFSYCICSDGQPAQHLGDLTPHELRAAAVIIKSSPAKTWFKNEWLQSMASLALIWDAACLLTVSRLNGWGVNVRNNINVSGYRLPDVNNLEVSHAVHTETSHKGLNV